MLNIKTNNFEKKGYSIIKNFLDEKQIDFYIKEIFKDLKFKNNKETIGGQSQLISNSNYWDLFTNNKLIDCIKSALKNEEVCFVQHTDIHINFGSGIFHRDNSNRKFMSSPDWDEQKNKYGVLRVAIYMSSYDESGNSLSFVANSHRKQSSLQIKEIKLFNKIHNFFRKKFNIQIPHFLFFSKVEKIRLEKGDLVFFDERILHAGGKINFKNPKISIFFAYGLKNHHTKNHIKFLNKQSKNNDEKGNNYEQNIPIDLQNVLKENNIYYD